MAAAPLPPSLHARLDALAGRVRRLRVARGACWVVLAALLSGVALVLLDATFSLSVTARCLLELAWLGLVALLGWLLVVRPWQVGVPLEEVARQIEGQFPGLGERLLTVVSLRDAADPANGSPQLIAGLARETELRTRGMDFAQTAPVRPVAWLAGVAGAVLLVAVVAAAIIPGTGQQLRRVAVPWYQPSAVAPFRVHIASGDPVIRRGDAVTLAGYLERTEPGAPLPDSAVLAIREAGGAVRKVPMTGDGAAAFHVTRPRVDADFDYRIEAGVGASEWHAVTVADPVEVTNQTTIEISPPAYATAAMPTRTLEGLPDLDGLQFSVATLRLRFDRPAASAALEWRPEGRLTEPAETVPVQLATDGRSATASVRLKGNGTLRLVLLNESGPRRLRSETALSVRVMPDAPPRFEQVAGVYAQPRTVRPDERVPISLVALDDIGVAGAELEYVVGSDLTKISRVPVPLAGANTPRAEGRFVFDLTGKGHEGETVRIRVRVTDNRRVDDVRLGPQEAVYPPGGWAEFRLSGSAPPLDRQEIYGQRDAMKEALLAALKEVRQAQTDAETLRTDTAGRSPLPVDHAVRIAATRDRARKAAGLLLDAARDAALTPDLRPLAAAVRDIADRPLKDADDALRKAATDNPSDRKAALDSAVKLLADGGDRIEELLRLNDLISQDRLDRRRLDALAADQKDLADRAKPGANAPRDELVQAQEDLLRRLRALVAESDPLRRGADAAAGREARRLADEARALAGLLRELDAAARQLTADFRRSLLDALTGVQGRAADRAADLLARIETAARLAGLTPPRPDDFRKVVELLRQDKTVEALIELEKLAQALERIADEFEKWELDRKDPKVAARQLALWQDDLRTRLLTATKGTPFDKLPDPQKAALRVEQRAILKAAEALRLQAGSEATVARGAAVTALQAAVQLLEGDARQADAVLKTAVETLNRLADKTPTVAQRLATVRPELDRIRIEQDQIANAVEPLVKAADPRQPQPLADKLAPWRDKQEKLAKQLAALDLPGFEPRQARCVAALDTAAADMKAGLPYDCAASLLRAIRELDRLKHSLDNPPAADDKAADLARRQLVIAETIAGLGDKADPRQLEAVAAAQQDIHKQLATLLAPEAPALLNDAQQAVSAAEAGFRPGSKVDDLKRRTRAAADALARLSARLNGLEPDLDRVRRLAAYRRQAVEDAKKMAGKPFNPDVSGEAGRQIGREIEELTHTRVGVAGQPLKRVVVELYSRYKMHTEPDRQAGIHKELAEALDRLAAAMTDVRELAARPDPPPALKPADADAYLPSKLLADALRELARQQRAVRDRANGVNAEVERQTRPAEVNPLAGLEQRQRVLMIAIGEFTRRLITEKEPIAAEEAAKATEAARLAADRLKLGQVRPAREAAELVAQRLKQVAAATGNKPWGKQAADLATKQEEILSELLGLLDRPDVAAAQQKTRELELAKKAFELAHMLELAAKNAPPGGPAAALMDAAALARKAEALLTEAATKAQNGRPAEAEKLRAQADKLLAQAADKAMAAAPPGMNPEPDPAAAATGDAIREADTAMKRATDALGPNGDPVAAERAMRQATDALTRAAKSPGSSPNPPPSAGATGPQSNGNAGTTPAPTTANDPTPEKIGDWAKAWGDLPGDIKAKYVQDLKAKYGEDYARSIKLYFEQLAERK